MGLKEKLFGSHSSKEIKRISPLVKKIEDLRPSMMKLSDEQMAAKTEEFKKRLAAGETLDDLLVEAFALVREATRRKLGTEHYPVQLMGGIILHQGRIAEMKTGEGKTQTCLLPSYLNALEGRGVHVVTVNDYLANRDAEWMGQVHRALGLTVGVVLNSMTSEERKEAYSCDITYVTNNELGFDYLRDNMVVRKEDLVQRELNYAIVDEVDSILIDEARTPLIISGQSAKSTKLYELCDILAKQLQRGEAKELGKMDIIMGEKMEETGDFVVNEKEKSVNLTEQGVRKVEQFFKIENLADPENLEIQHNIILALRAHNLMHRDQDYVVKDDQILIVDEFTGRIMPGRRYSDGLHQAIEAKEHVQVKRESRTLATITFQNFFNKYRKKAGMTGTALTEENEFRNIYGMDVVEIPTNVPVIRQDLQDAVYKTKKEKYKAVIDEIVAAHEKGQPVLVGTITIETSELLSKMLSKRGVKHNVLNAKFHEQEAQIVAEAGKHGAVTIATNMAGRGTDIKLDDEAKAAGGLKIIGTERHEARRIDNQLRGRSGRQGDPGESRFYISLEDDLMRLFGSERLMGVFNTLGVDDGEQIEHKMLSNAIERAQEKIENNNFGIRKNLLEYDEVMNEQREIIYAERRRVLDGESMRESIFTMIDATAERIVNANIVEGTKPDEWDMTSFNESWNPVFGTVVGLSGEQLSGGYSKDDFRQDMIELGHRLYEAKEKEFPVEEHLREVERVVLLRVIDRHWMNHIDDMDQLRQGIGLQAYGQRDPVVEYKMAGYDMFDGMIAGIQEDTVRVMMHIKIEQEVKREQVVKPMATNKDDSAVKAPKKRADDKVYPNDPCPCGSGKKYKHCCGRKA
ncbi:MAG: preprotein translocase subunit SecA [Lachnospiraceae bacterium]|nr:preprotein translocase subunit SecA [Lachnospiraceae bacterium]